MSNLTAKHLEAAKDVQRDNAPRFLEAVDYVKSLSGRLARKGFISMAGEDSANKRAMFIIAQPKAGEVIDGSFKRESEKTPMERKALSFISVVIYSRDSECTPGLVCVRKGITSDSNKSSLMAAIAGEPDYEKASTIIDGEQKFDWSENGAQVEKLLAEWKPKNGHLKLVEGFVPKNKPVQLQENKNTLVIRGLEHLAEELRDPSKYFPSEDYSRRTGMGWHKPGLD